MTCLLQLRVHQHDRIRGGVHLFAAMVGTGGAETASTLVNFKGSAVLSKREGIDTAYLQNRGRDGTSRGGKDWDNSSHHEKSRSSSRGTHCVRKIHE